MDELGLYGVENGHLAFAFRDLALVVSPELHVEFYGRQRGHVQGGLQVHVGHLRDACPAPDAGAGGIDEGGNPGVASQFAGVVEEREAVGVNQKRQGGLRADAHHRGGQREEFPQVLVGVDHGLDLLVDGGHVGFERADGGLHGLGQHGRRAGVAHLAELLDGYGKLVLALDQPAAQGRQILDRRQRGVGGLPQAGVFLVFGRIDCDSQRIGLVVLAALQADGLFDAHGRLEPEVDAVLGGKSQQGMGVDARSFDADQALVE